MSGYWASLFKFYVMYVHRLSSFTFLCDVFGLVFILTICLMTVYKLLLYTFVFGEICSFTQLCQFQRMFMLTKSLFSKREQTICCCNKVFKSVDDICDFLRGWKKVGINRNANRILISPFNIPYQNSPACLVCLFPENTTFAGLERLLTELTIRNYITALNIDQHWKV